MKFADIVRTKRARATPPEQASKPNTCHQIQSQTQTSRIQYIIANQIWNF